MKSWKEDLVITLSGVYLYTCALGFIPVFVYPRVLAIKILIWASVLIGLGFPVTWVMNKESDGDG